MENKIISLTAQIVSAHIAANHVSTEQLPVLIRDVYQALATVGQALAEPAVAEKKSVFADHILCLDCGQSFKMLKRHLTTDHQMTPEEYRTKWNLPPSYPMVAAEYAARRSMLALAGGLGRKVEAPLNPTQPAKKGGVGRNAVSPPPPKKRGRPKKG